MVASRPLSAAKFTVLEMSPHIYLTAATALTKAALAAFRTAEDRQGGH